MQPNFPLRSSVVAGLLAATWSGVALGGEGDLLTLSASALYSYDSNVFRVADGVYPTGNNHRGDSILAESAGADLNKVFGRQRIYGNLSVKDSHYQDFTFLNNQGYQGMLAYRAGFGSDSEAGVFYSNSNQLSNYADRTGIYERNMVNTIRYGGDVMLRVAGDWMGVASASQGHDRNSADDLKSGGSEIQAYDGGVRYAPRGSKNYVEARYRNSSVDYNESVYDYRQDEGRVTALWSPNLVSSFEGSLSRINNRHQNRDSYDFNGWAGYFSYTWRPTVSTSTSLRLARDVGASGDAWGSFSRTNSMSLRQTWQASAKIAIEGGASYLHRSYLGYQTATTVNGEDSRRDKVYALDIGSTYAVTEKFQARMSVRRDERSSTIDTYSFTDWVTMLSVQYKF